MLRKIQLQLTSWKSTIRLPLTVDNVKGIKVRWLYYTTANTGSNVLFLASPNFRSNGYVLDADGSSTDYFFSMPLDSQSQVTVTMSDFTDNAFDIVFQKPVESINQFGLEISINSVPAIGLISIDNPVVLELGFYS